MIEMSDKPKVVVYRGQGWSLIRVKKSTNIYVVASDKGRPRLYESVGTGNITEAMKVGREKYRLWQRSNAVPSGRLLLCDHWVNLKALREKEIEVGDLLESTHRSTVNAWERMESFWGSKLPSEINQENWVTFKTVMKEKWTRPSLQPEFKCLNILANYMHRIGAINHPPNIDIGKGNSKPLEPRRIIPPEHLTKLLSESLKAGPLIHLFICNGAYHGMRIEEVACLEQKNFRQVDGVWYQHISKSKTGPRTIKVSDTLVPLFQGVRSGAPHKYFFSRTRGDLSLRPSTQVWDRHWRAIRDGAGFDYVFHELRHTAISNAIAADINPGKVSRYFGVSLQEIDRTYLKLNEGQTSACADVLRA